MAFSGAARFMIRNRIDDAVVTASSAATPAARIQSYRPGRRWFATGKISEYVQLDFGEEVLLQDFGLVNFNLDAAGTVEIKLSNASNFAVLVAESGELEAWAPVYGLGDDPLGESLGGYPELNSFNDYRAYLTFRFAAIQSARYARIYLKNPTNPDITQVALGWAFAGVAEQFDWNFDFNWGWDWEDPSEIIATETSEFIRRRKTVRTLALQLADMSEAEAIGPMNTIKRALGASKTFMVDMFPEGNEPLRYATTIYGRAIGGADISNPAAAIYQSGLTIKELAA